MALTIKINRLTTLIASMVTGNRIAISNAFTPSLQFEDQLINDISADYINAIEQSEAVFLHIRRGDYLNKENQKVFAECPLNYFENAANRIKEDIKKRSFLCLFQRYSVG